jgi:hypothetical protein
VSDVSELYDDLLKKKFELLSPHFDERERRLFLAAEAASLGRGGVTQVAAATGTARITIYKGLEDLKGEVSNRIRKPGGGRKSAQENQPELIKALDQLVDPVTRGDPMSHLRWTCKSTRQLANELRVQGFQVSHTVVAELLKEQNYNGQHNLSKATGC